MEARQKLKRIVKSPEVRRKEFFEATNQFLYSIGYQKMSIKMLTEHLGVAKGTFYHHFKSKEDLLTQWVFFRMKPVIDQQESIVRESGKSAIEKLNTIWAISRSWKLENLDMIISLMRIMYHDHNLKLREEMNRQSAELSSSMMQILLEQGVAEGEFKAISAMELSRILPRINQLFADDMARRLLNINQDVHSADHLLSSAEEWQALLERILGAAPNSLNIVDRDFIYKVFERLKNQKAHISI